MALRSMRAERVLAQPVNLDEVCRDEHQLRLLAGHPQGADDVVVGLQLGVQHQVVLLGAAGRHGEHVAVLETHTARIAGSCRW